MNIPMAGKPIVGLLIAPEGSKAYCVFKDTLSPDLIYNALGTRDFSYCVRYLGPIPFLIVYCCDAPRDAITTIHGPNRERVIIGNSMIFGRDEDGSFRSLTEFELNALRSNTSMLSKRNITYFGVNGMTKDPRPLEFGPSESDNDVLSQNEAISLMNESGR